jgi:hypothetical protein
MHRFERKQLFNGQLRCHLAVPSACNHQTPPPLMFVSLSAPSFDDTYVNFQKISLNCDIWDLQRARPIGPTLLIDMSDTYSLGSTAAVNLLEKLTAFDHLVCSSPNYPLPSEISKLRYKRLTIPLLQKTAMSLIPGLVEREVLNKPRC